ITDLPEIQWLDLNDESFGGEHTTAKPFTEEAYLFRALVQTDKIMDEDETKASDQHAQDIRAYLRAFSLDFNDKFFNGHHRSGGNAKSLVGIRERLDYPEKYGTDSDNLIDANSVDMSRTGKVEDFAIFVEL